MPSSASSARLRQTCMWRSHKGLLYKRDGHAARVHAQRPARACFQSQSRLSALARQPGGPAPRRQTGRAGRLRRPQARALSSLPPPWQTCRPWPMLRRAAGAPGRPRSAAGPLDRSHLQVTAATSPTHCVHKEQRVLIVTLSLKEALSITQQSTKPCNWHGQTFPARPHPGCL